MRLPKMPEIYIEEFKSSGGASKCHGCKSDAGGRSLCPIHLVLAARRFHAWTERRHRMGLCILCEREGDIVGPRGDRRTHRGIRCAFHRGVNVERCKRWSAQNAKRVYYERKEAGVCTHSPKHGPAVSGSLCAACRVMARESRRRTARRQAAI